MIVRLLVLVAVAFTTVAVDAAAAASNHDAGCARTAGASTLGVLECGRAPVVPALDPQYETGKPRLRLAATREPIPRCRPAELVFYAARDWLRLGAKLAEHASPCADYYISVPPLVADKTNPRPNQAWRIRALGRRFHAMAEIHWTTWQSWARANGRTMYDAGVEARRRMAAAGYDVANGDTWAVNEFPSSVRRNLGTARADARDFVRGLLEGDGVRVQGAVFVIGVWHGTGDASAYKRTLKEWLADGPFWIEMQRAVRFWGQEVYGDARRWGVPGATAAVRRDYLNDFLQHAAKLGVVAPAEHGAARWFLERAHTPVANAGWQWPAGLGWTMVSGDQMRHFVSSQTYALRHFAASRPGPDAFGFAWAPNNSTSMPEREFVAQTGRLLDRLGAALAESGTESRPDPGLHACASGGIDWCHADVEGASFTDAWRIFSAWRDGLPDAVRDGYVRLLEAVRTLASGVATR
ncbi:MAG: hypothetical protein M3310_03195 [Actinomycetota bacterium]|nr:hypothetical protein [Actinomycetota bacterium]